MDFNKQSSNGDLHTPEHDQLMIALMNQDKWRQLITKYDLLPDINETTALEIRPEVPIVQETSSYNSYDPPKRYIIGYIDIVVQPVWPHRARVNCEIKATEDSLGGLIRQINKYDVYCDKDERRWVVVSPWSEWEEPLKSQGITWISSEEVLLGFQPMKF